MGVLLNYPKFQALDDKGDFLVGGLLYAYIAGTTTAKTTYSDYNLATANAHPVVLDRRGEAIVYGSGMYKFILKDINSNTIWTMDNVVISSSGAGDYTFYPNPSEADQAATSTGGSIKDILTALGTSKKATIILGHTGASNTTTYTVGQNADWSAYTNVTFKVVPGAVLSHGAFTITFGGPVELSPGSLSGAGLVTFADTSVSNVNPDWYVGTDTQAVQYAVNSCLANYASGDSKSIPMIVKRKYTLTASINIDRPVDTTFELFRIVGLGQDAGFHTALNDGSSLITSTIDATAGKAPVSEGVSFEGIRFSSSTTGLSNYAVDGSKFLRVNFDRCAFDKIRLAYSDYYFQSWHLNHPTITRVTGIFMEVNAVGTSTAQGSFYDVHIISQRTEGNATQTGLVKGTYWDGSSIVSGVYENAIGPLLDASVFGGVISGMYTEQSVAPVIKLQASDGVALVGNLFSNAYAGTDYAVDCGTAANVSSVGNYGGGNMYKITGMLPLTTGSVIAGMRGFSSIGDKSATGGVTDVTNTSFGENITQQAILTTAHVDSTLVLADAGALLVTVSEPLTGDTVQSGTVVLISRIGTGTNIQVLSAGSSSLAVTCETATGYKVRITNPTGGTLYAIASILRLR